VDDGLVAAVPAENDRGIRAARDKLAREPRRNRRLAGTTDGKISNAYYRHRNIVRLQQSPVVE
jgi:hypothetical protein